MALTENEKKTGQDLMNFEILMKKKRNSLEIGQIIYCYNPITGDVFEGEYTIGIYCGTFLGYDYEIKIFADKKDREKYIKLDKSFQDLIAKKLAESMKSQFEQFADVEKMGLGGTYEFATSCIDVEKIEGGRGNHALNDMTEVDRVLCHYRSFKHCKTDRIAVYEKIVD